MKLVIKNFGPKLIVKNQNGKVVGTLNVIKECSSSTDYHHENSRCAMLKIIKYSKVI